MRYEGVGDALRRMWASEGLAGFYRGMQVKLAQTVLAAALMMVLKEVGFVCACDCVRVHV
jgi:adenine nucleotide transporter 17